MGIDSILNWFKLAPEDEDYDDDFADDYVEEEEVRPRYREEKRAAKQEAPSFDDYDEPAPQPKRTSFRTSTNKVVPIRTAPNGLEVCIIKPSNFGESQQV